MNARHGVAVASLGLLLLAFGFAACGAEPADVPDHGDVPSPKPKASAPDPNPKPAAQAPDHKAAEAAVAANAELYKAALASADELAADEKLKLKEQYGAQYDKAVSNVKQLEASIAQLQAHKLNGLIDQAVACWRKAASLVQAEADEAAKGVPAGQNSAQAQRAQWMNNAAAAQTDWVLHEKLLLKTSLDLNAAAMERDRLALSVKLAMAEIAPRMEQKKQSLKKVAQLHRQAIDGGNILGPEEMKDNYQFVLKTGTMPQVGPAKPAPTAEIALTANAELQKAALATADELAADEMLKLKEKHKAQYDKAGKDMKTIDGSIARVMAAYKDLSKIPGAALTDLEVMTQQLTKARDLAFIARDKLAREVKKATADIAAQTDQKKRDIKKLAQLHRDAIQQGNILTTEQMKDNYRTVLKTGAVPQVGTPKAAGAPLAIKDLKELDGKATIVASDGTFLGKITSNELDPKSILSAVGPHGSDKTENSIFNKNGKYGGKLSPNSPFSDTAPEPPKVFIGDRFVGFLTTNKEKKPQVDPQALFDALKEK